jgi:hypothetical protein
LWKVRNIAPELSRQKFFSTTLPKLMAPGTTVNNLVCAELPNRGTLANIDSPRLSGFDAIHQPPDNSFTARYA